MSKQDYEQLTLFPEDSPANRLALLGSEEARMTTVISGRKCLESYENYSRLGLLVRMCLESSIWHSTRCTLTWKRKDTKFNASLFQLAVSMPRTKDSELRLWPTPSTGAALCGGTGNFQTLKRMEESGLITEEERKAFSQGNGGKTNPQLVEWLMGYEQKFTELIPTPRVSAANGAPAGRCWMPSSQTVQVERERETEPVPRSAGRTVRTHSAWENWPTEPDVGRVADGIPNRVDRLKCLGNAVVPQQFYPIFEAIAKIEMEVNHA